MEDSLISLLQTFGFDVMLQGSMTQDADYPDHFFTFWNNYTDGVSYYDDDFLTAIYSYDVNYYSTDPEDVYTTLRAAVKLLKDSGWTVPPDGHTVASDEPTHTGRGITVLYLKQEV